MTRRRRPTTPAEPEADASASPSEPEGDASPSGGHRFTISEAAEATGVSRDTIKRRRAADRFPNAALDAEGVWRIPLADLLADGLTVNAPGAGDPEHQGVSPAPAPAPEVARLAALEAENRELRARLEERDRALRLAEVALRALPAAPPSHQGDAPARRPWWPWGRRP